MSAAEDPASGSLQTQTHGGPLPRPLTRPPHPGQRYRVGHLRFRIDEAQDIIQTHNVVNDIKLKERKVLLGRAHPERRREGALGQPLT